MTGGLKHRDDFLVKEEGFIDRCLLWITNNVLGTRWLFLSSLSLPLVVLVPGMGKYQVPILFFSNYIQLWALPALQRTSMSIQTNQDAKADVDRHNIELILRAVEKPAC